MAAIDGQWDSVTQSPMGEQRSTLTLTSKPDGSFAGTNAGALGSIDVTDGRVAGDLVTCKMVLTMPMPMTLTIEARISGDRIEGTVDTGVFGKYPMTATRKG